MNCTFEYNNQPSTSISIQALFEKIADRKSMAIRADKLYRIISKTDRSKSTIERYRLILNVELKGGKIQGRNGVLRVISRGPFLSMFKHESKSFVSSLENSARSLKMSRRRRKKNSSDSSNRNGCGHIVVQEIKENDKEPNSVSSSEGCNGSSNDKEDLASTKRTIVTAPAALSQELKDEAVNRPNGLKRKKTDNVGMIILADKDYCDEMSAVSVSPVNAALEAKAAETQREAQVQTKIEAQTQTLQVIQEIPVNVPSASRKIIIAKGKLTPSINTKSKNKKKSSKKSSKKKKSANSDSSCNNRKSLIRSERNINHRYNLSQLEEEVSGHNRYDSSLESISNIREVMQANATPGSNKRQKTMHYAPKTPIERKWLNSGPITSKTESSMYDPSPYALHPLMHPTTYGHADGMNSRNQEVNSYANIYTSSNAEENQEADLCSGDDSNCFILDGLISFFKQFMGPQQKNIVQSNPKRNSVPQSFALPPLNEPTFSQYAARNGYQYIHQYHQPHDNPYLMQNNQHLLNSNGNSKFGFGMPVYEQVQPHTSTEDILGQTSYLKDAERFTASSSRLQEGKLSGNHDVSDKLKVYDYEPRFKLPEPGSYQKEVSKLSRNNTPTYIESRNEESTISRRSERNRHKKEPTTSDNDLVEGGVCYSSISISGVSISSTSNEWIRDSEPKDDEQTKRPKNRRSKSRGERKVELGTKVLKDKSPQLKGRSRSMSDVRFSQAKSITTCSLTRGTSCGSSVSSLSGLSEAERSENCSQIRYYHYR